ncbi:hypothetical protein AAC387_Pa04g2068 [Persea americana]
MADNGKVNIGSRVASTIGWAEVGGHFPNENTFLIEGGKFLALIDAACREDIQCLVANENEGASAEISGRVQLEENIVEELPAETSLLDHHVNMQLLSGGAESLLSLALFVYKILILINKRLAWCHLARA